MNYLQPILFFAVIVGCIIAVKLIFSWHRKQAKIHFEKERKAQEIALRASPPYLELQRLELARQKQQAEIQLKFAEFAHKRHLDLTHISPETYLLYEPQAITALPSLKRIIEQEKATAPDEAIPPFYQQPPLETIIEELTPNALEFIFGLDPLTGQLAKITLPKAVHIQLLGASGQGKSRQATSILTQLTARNDTNHLQLALIDCEGETTTPFQSLPHVRYLADEPKEAARTFRGLVSELERRDITKLAFPVILIFVEEFLNLRRTMPESYREQALEDYTTLALRGRKRGLFLFSIGQTAYTEKAIRDAQAQFLSSMAFAVKPTAARAAGFTNTDLLNKLYSERRPGQFLLERPAGDSILLAPFVDSRAVTDTLGTSWSTPQARQDEVPPTQEAKQREVETEPIQFCAQDMLILDCMSRGLTINQIMAEVYNITKPGSEYQKKLPELRSSMQRIAQHTKTSIGV